MPLDRTLAASVARTGGLALPVYAVTLFASAGLLFSVQPMFTKMVLPKLGGTPAVWSVATVFFQSVLLAGYAYAHGLATRLSVRRAALVHLGLMALVLVVALPIGLAAGFERPPAEGQTTWLFTAFAASVGLPFFVLSANGPLLQAWFARVPHPQASNPYSLYAASNLGSLLALVAYPILIEPVLPTAQQSALWTWSFAALVAGIAACAGYAGSAPRPARIRGEASAGPRPTWRQRAGWLTLAAVPSALLVAVTAHVATDVASAPLLWVAPLALFLLTFVITFQDKPILPHRAALAAHPILVGLTLVLLTSLLQLDWRIALVVNLGAFFVTAMVCHGELVARRPAPERLTEFYFWMSAGGLVGGVFAALVAPHLFATVLEYPLLLVAGLACRPGITTGHRRLAIAIAAAGLVVATALAVYGVPAALTGGVVQISLIAMLATAILAERKHPGRLIGLAIAGPAVLLAIKIGGEPVSFVRSFFGVHMVREVDDGRFRILAHGTTTHGIEAIRDEAGQLVTGRPEPLAYYHASGAIVGALNALRSGLAAPASIGVVGLGTGALACHGRPGERWSAYEIDPEVVRIARDARLFRYLSACAPDLPIHLGDARITLADAPAASYDVLVVDAFSSDAIPIHLLTTEALALYAEKVAVGGAIILHVSNRNLELASVVAAVGSSVGLQAHRRLSRPDEALRRKHVLASEVVVLAKAGSDRGDALRQAGFAPLAPRPDVRPWTDDYSDIIGALRRRFQM